MKPQSSLLGYGYALAALRIVASLLFFIHGFQHLTGFQSTMAPAPMFTKFWFAGVIEVIGATLTGLGLWTRPVAFILAGEMAVAYFTAHAPRGLWPISNGGELSILFCFIYLFLAVSGPGSLSVKD